MKKGGLGKGLGSIFDNNIEELENADIRTLRISEIEPNAQQPRRIFDEEKLEELANSIREHGVIQPLIVRQKENGNYEIVAGERRWRASRIAGLVEVPAIVRDYTQEQTMMIAMIENLQREDLNPIEEADGCKFLMEQCNMTQEQLAEKLGKSRSAVANCLRLLNLPEKARQYVSDGLLSAGHARAVLAVENTDVAEQLAEKIVKNGMSVRQAEAEARLCNMPPKTKSEKKDETPDYISALERKITEAVGRKCKLTYTKQKGTLTLEYYGDDDLSQLLELLGVYDE